MHVYYCFQPSAEMQGKDFGLTFEWDVPLLEGYPNSFLHNVAAKPGWGYRDTNTPELRDLIPRREFDAWVINGWTTRSEWLAIRACWKARIPMLIRGDSTLIDKRSLLTRIAKRVILGRWIPRFSRYLTVGKLNEKYYEFYGADRTRFVPVRHFVDNDWFSKQAMAARLRRDDLRRDWNIDPDALVFLFAGKLIEKKKPVDAILALGRVKRSARKVHLLIAGEGELRDACASAAASAGVPVTFAGFLNQSRMPQAYAASDVLVLSSAWQETWGLVVNEAMASGLPAIVSDRVGCAPDLVTPGVTGEVYPSGDIAALANRMEHFVDSPSKALEQGRRALDRIANYSIDAATENTVAAIVDTVRA